MKNHDDKLDTEIKRAWPENGSGQVPAFAATWRAAEVRHARSRRRYGMLAATAAIVAIAIVGLQLQAPPTADVSYIDVEDLMGSTSWTAPSDVLLPAHEFDIYQELPSLLESTEAAGGTLL